MTKRFAFYIPCSIKMAQKSRQCALQFRRWGGRRSGAGRKPKGPSAGVPHRARPAHCRRHPVHVTLRAARGIPSLRGAGLFPALRDALAVASSARFRVVQFSVQVNHVHLLVEAEERMTLSRGMQGLSVRLARSINRRLRRSGTVWADRYHSRALRTPTEVRRALVYVLRNGRKHGVSGPGMDPCSSGAWFSGWSDLVAGPREPAPVRAARTWLLRVGWQRSGVIRFNDMPSRAAKRRRAGAGSSYGGAGRSQTGSSLGTATTVVTRRDG